MSRLLSRMCGKMMRTHCVSHRVWQHSMPISSQTGLSHVPPSRAGEVSVQTHHHIACVYNEQCFETYKPQFATRILCKYKGGQMTARKITYGQSACATVMLSLLVFCSILREDIIYHALSYPPISFSTCTIMYIFLT